VDFCQGNSDIIVRFQITIKLLSEKKILLWVTATNYVEEIKCKLEYSQDSYGSVVLYLQGKQLEDLSQQSNYNICKDSTLSLAFCLHGGVVQPRVPSSSKTNYFKDVVRFKPSPRVAQSPAILGPYLVEKYDEVLVLDISNPNVINFLSYYRKCVVICHFNGFWPYTIKLYQWILLN
jgi:hypothetical protein